MYTSTWDPELRKLFVIGPDGKRLLSVGGLTEREAVQRVALGARVNRDTALLKWAEARDRDLTLQRRRDPRVLGTLKWQWPTLEVIDDSGRIVSTVKGHGGPQEAITTAIERAKNDGDHELAEWLRARPVDVLDGHGKIVLPAPRQVTA
jgi:hypothetical protein